MASPIHVHQADFEEKVMKSAVPVLVDFWAEWCGPCKMIAPFLDEIAGEMDGKVVVAKVDVDADPTLAEKFGIQSIPTLLIVKGGTIGKMLIGYLPKAEIKKALAEAGIA